MCRTFPVFGLQIYVFPLCCILAFDTALAVYLGSSRYPNGRTGFFLRAVCYCLMMAACGGKLLFALVRLLQGKNFWDALWRGGFVFYGGLLGGAAGLALFCIREKQNYLDWGDLLCSLLPLCQAIGRFGCFCNGCCYGKPYAGAGSVPYPVDGEMVRVYPTWFMESFGCIVLFIRLWVGRGRRNRGSVAGGYLIGYGVLRFSVEFFRGDAVRGVWGLLSTSQMISIFLLVMGTGIKIYTKKHKVQNEIWEEKEL